MTRYAKRVDLNQQAIAAACIAAGWKIHYCYMFGGGIPDLVAYRDGCRVWLEVKQRGEQLTKPEHLFFSQWGPGRAIVVYSPEDAVEKLSHVERGEKL